MARIAIIGLGPVGTAIGLALTEAFATDRGRAAELALVGYDPDFKQATAARARGAVQTAARSIAEAVGAAELVVIAQAAPDVLQSLSAMAPHLPAESIVTDTADTKVEVLRAAAATLPAGVSFVGGHPILLPPQAVRGSAGVQSARADLFAGAVYCVCPAPGATDAAVETVQGLAQALGATPFFLDPYEHDGLWAGLSQAPYLCAAALLTTIAQSESWRDLKLLADPTWRRLGELLDTAPPGAAQSCLTNRQPLVSWLDRLIAALVEVRQELAAPEGAGAAMERLVAQAQAAREEWDRRRDDRHKEVAALSAGGTSAREQLLGLFVPRRLLEKRGPDAAP